MYDHQDLQEARGMEQELHRAHIQETAARTVGQHAKSFFWAAIGISALVASVAFAYSI